MSTAENQDFMIEGLEEFDNLRSQTGARYEEIAQFMDSVKKGQLQLFDWVHELSGEMNKQQQMQEALAKENEELQAQIQNDGRWMEEQQRKEECLSSEVEELRTQVQNQQRRMQEQQQ